MANYIDGIGKHYTFYQIAIVVVAKMMLQSSVPVAKVTLN